MNESQLFIHALQFATADERDAYLNERCGGDAQLRQDVEALLRAHTNDPDFLEISLPFGASVQSVIRARSESLGSKIGPYTLQQQIGEGGMGVVYLAAQLEPVQREVALKIIKPGMDSSQVVARFEVERQALALMDHVNIARVLDAGTTDLGRPYFVMELVHGVPITEYCDDHHLTMRERLELFVPVCHAIHHAHQKGVIHRDIKPSNVLVTQYESRPVPKVIDFGVAKAIEHKLTERTLFTQFGMMVGTLEYMSPEQAEWSELGIDTRSDIYSLGALLYELLTGNAPLSGTGTSEASVAERLRMVREDEPVKPSTRWSTSSEDLSSLASLRQSDPVRQAKLMRGELDWIVMKTLEKDRNRRYESASAFAADLQRYLSDEPVQACPPSTAYRFRKFARRNKVALATASVIVLAILLTVAALATSTILIANALSAQTESKEDLRNALSRERNDSYFHRIALAHRKLSEDDLAGALSLLNDCPDDLRSWEWHYLHRLCQAEPIVLRNLTPATSVAFSHDGSRLVASGGDGTVKIWNGLSGQLLQTLPAHHELAYSVAFHPSGNLIASVGERRRVKILELTTATTVFEAPCDAVHSNGAAYTVAFSPDGRLLAVGNEGVVNVWDWKQNLVVHSFPGHERRAISVAFARDGRYLATGSWAGIIQLWDVIAGGKPIRTFPETNASPHPIVALAFDHSGERLAAASFGRRVDIWDTTSGDLVRSIPHKGLVLGVTFSPDGRRLASCGEDKAIRIWESTSGREILALRGHLAASGCVAFSPDGLCLASASTDRTIRIWDAHRHQSHERQESLTFSQHPDEVWSVAVSPSGERIASAGWSMPAKIWETNTGREDLEIRGHQGVDFCVAWQPNGQCVALAGRDGPAFTVKVWSSVSGREVFSLPPGPEYLSVTYSPDGQHLITGRASRELQVWDANSGELITVLGSHAREVRAVAFSRDGRQLASASDDGTVKLWDGTRLDTPQEARLPLAAWIPGPSSSIAFSPDGRRLVTGGAEHTVKIWDVQTGEERQVLRGHRGDVYAVAFSPDPDGQWVASAGEDTTVKLWNSHSGALVHSFRGHMGLVCSVSFTPDGQRLISGSRDHTVKVWNLTRLQTELE